MTKKQKLRRQCDKLAYEICLSREPLCEVCFHEAIQAHHFYYRSSYGHLRFDLDNLISLCQGCHAALHFKDPKKIEDLIIYSRGKQWYNRIKKKSKNRPEGSYQTVGYYTKILESLLNEALKQ